MSRRRLALALLACALLASTGLRVAGTADKRGITHDESISYLAAACQQGDYAEVTVFGHPPFGRWVPASEWKALLRPERALCFGEIAHDLAREDIHPPLYFWLLHLWGLAFGVGAWTGASLNIVLAAATCLALFGLARRVLGDPLRGALVAFVWSFSPAAIRVFAEARQYELLALVATLFVWQCVRFADPPDSIKRPDALLLAVATAAGALTQFLFSLVAVAGAGLLAARLWRSERSLLAGGLASIAAGYAMFSLVHPGFLMSVARSRAQAVSPAGDLLAGRIEITIETVAGFLLPPGLASGALGYAVVALLVAATAWVAASPPRAMPLVFAWLAAAHAALYLGFLSPGGAMDFKHLSAVWPFAAFVPVLVVARLGPRARAPAAVAGCSALLAAGGAAALGRGPTDAPPASLERAHAVLVDNVARGVLPRVVWRLRDDARVFASDQPRLLDDPGAWLPSLAPGDLAVLGTPPSDPRYGNSAALAERVRATLARRFRVEAVPDSLERGRVYRLERLGRPRREADDKPRRADRRAPM